MLSSKMIPARPTKKINIPNVGGKMPYLKPLASTLGSTLVVSGMMSKREINPMVNPKNPKTRANRLIDFISCRFFCVLFLMPRMMKMIKISSKSTKGYMNVGPPSESKCVIRFVFKF